MSPLKRVYLQRIKGIVEAYKMNDIVMFMVSYVVVIFISFFIINWLQRGLLINFLKVKSGRGKRVLCKVRGKVEDYYRPAITKDDGLILKFSNDKEPSTLVSVDSSCFYRSAGVTMIDIDEVSKMAISKSWKAIPTHDPVIMTNLIKRAQMSAGIDDKILMAVLVIVLINVLAVIVVGIMVNDVKTIVSGVKAMGNVVAGTTL